MSSLSGRAQPRPGEPTRRCPELDRNMPEYRCQDELAALTSERVRAALATLGIRIIAIGDLPAPGR